jgi:lipopolysaccharide assembly protein A
MDWRFILSLLFAVIVSVFALQNAPAVEIRFLTFTVSVSQALVILISAMFGAVTVALFNTVRWFKMKSKEKSSAKNIAALEEVNRLLQQKLDSVQASQKEVVNLPKQNSQPNPK